MTKKFCTECGKELKESENFCPSCGANINEESSNKTKLNIFPIIIGLIGIFIVWFLLESRSDTSQYVESSIYVSIFIGTAIGGFLYKKISIVSVIIGVLTSLIFVFYIMFIVNYSLPPDVLDVFIISPIVGLVGAIIGGYLNQTFGILS